MFCRAILLLLLFPMQVAFSQPGVETFIRMSIGMASKDAVSLFKKDWPVAEEYETDIWATYAVGGPVDEYLPNSFRFLIYHYGYFVGDKELRISCSPETALKTFDSVRKRMTVLYGKSLVDTSKSMMGMKGMVRCLSWSFPKADYKDMYKLDVALYQVADRKTVTIQLIAFTKSYSDALEMRENDYLHLKGR